MKHVENHYSYGHVCLTVGGHGLVAARLRGGNGGAVAAGVVGGLAAGAIIGSQVNRGYYNSGPGYYDSGYQPAGSGCRTERQQVVDQYGNYRMRRVRVCD